MKSLKTSIRKLKKGSPKFGVSVVLKKTATALKAVATTSDFPKVSGKSNPLLLTPAHLTEREFQVLELLAKGCPAKEIHDKLSISVHTVNEHLHNIYHKLHITNCREAVRWYCEHRGNP